MMDKITLTFEAAGYARLREMVIAGGKFLATGENGIHSASQLLLYMDQQVEAQARAAAQKANGHDKQEIARAQEPT